MLADLPPSLLRYLGGQSIEPSTRFISAWKYWYEEISPKKIFPRLSLIEEEAAIVLEVYKASLTTLIP